MIRYFLTCAAALGLAGCANMSGLDAGKSFSCKAPDGIQCESMSGVYANTLARTLPGQRLQGNATPALPAEQSGTGRITNQAMTSGMPIRSAPQILRLWFAPWEDADGDLHDQHFVYVTLDTGKWLIEHNRRRIQETYRPVTAQATKFTGPVATPAESPTPIQDEATIPMLPAMPELTSRAGDRALWPRGFGGNELRRRP
jgi:conjugal transfer pilus assembly protein TraV